MFTYFRALQRSKSNQARLVRCGNYQFSTLNYSLFFELSCAALKAVDSEKLIDDS
jgi:hypothetical protein